MNTLKYAIRFLMRSKSYTLINLFGLAFSLACCIILMRYIHREMTVDTHCIDRENIVVALRDIEGNKFLTNLQEMDSVYIKPEQIMERCQLIIEAKANILHENQSYSMNLGATEGKFFEFFNYPVVEGEATLSAPQDAIITRQYAQRIFGNESPIGKVLSYGGKDITIKGMIDQPACKTTLQMDLFISPLLATWMTIYAFYYIFGGITNVLQNEPDRVAHTAIYGDSAVREFFNCRSLYSNAHIKGALH